jgi:para-nitrobenzyl esterase
LYYKKMPDHVAAYTDFGQIIGINLKDCCVFKGIPYAEPPIKELAFKAPLDPDVIDEPLEAFRYAPICLQSKRAFGGLLISQQQDMSRDCLYLNVFTPACDNAERPVLVWIHGGGFVAGSSASPWYDGVKFSSQTNCVLVTLNYRLGALGFLHLGDHLGSDYDTSGINGILDQLKAVEWVKRNVRAFGGNPNNITIFGESAGAMSIGVILGIKDSKKFYNRAILQSGAANNVLPREIAAEITELFIETAGIKNPEELLELSDQKLLDTQDQITTLANRLKNTNSIRAGLMFQPVIDGKILREHPLEGIRKASASGVDLIVGTNKDEWNLFNLFIGGPKDEAGLTRRILRFSNEADVSKYENLAKKNGVKSAFSQFMTDIVFHIPARQLLDAALIHHQNLYAYRFSYESRVLNSKLGACHALEIPFVFNNLDVDISKFFVGKYPPETLAVKMQSAWAAFAASGDPNGEYLGQFWPKYDAKNRELMVFDEELSLATLEI